MRSRARKITGVHLAAFAGISAVALAAAAFAAEYRMTVNRDRLVNAQSEPQNWLLMNGDYGATRYSKLTQFNRDNVKNLRLVWAIALEFTASMNAMVTTTILPLQNPLDGAAVRRVAFRPVDGAQWWFTSIAARPAIEDLSVTPTTQPSGRGVHVESWRSERRHHDDSR